MRDLESTNVEAAAYLAREAEPPDIERPDPWEYSGLDEQPREPRARLDVHEGCV
jgi:hypothetical protein